MRERKGRRTGVPSRAWPVRIGLLADVHIEERNARRVYSELYDHMLVPLDAERESVGAFMLLGDLFHKKILMEGDAPYYALRFVNELLDVMEGKPVRVLRGTRTHDHQQLDALRHLEGRNLAVVNSVDWEELVPGVSVLYVPEEYPVDAAAHYSEFLSGEAYWDVIAMHGAIDFATHSSVAEDSERPIRTAPVFAALDLLERANVTVAGHDHRGLSHKSGRIHYVGSYSRSCFGDEGRKGWAILEYDPGDGEHRMDRRENPDAPLFDTVRLSEVYSPGDDLAEVSARLSEAAEGRSLRIVVDVEETDAIAADVAVIRESVAGAIRIDRSRAPLVSAGEPEEWEDLPDPEDDGRPVHEVVADYVNARDPSLGITPERVLEITSEGKKR